MKNDNIEFAEGELNLISGGINTSGTSKSISEVSQNYELSVVLAGRGKLDVDHKMYEIEKEDVFVIYPGQKIRLRGEGLRHANVVFNGQGSETYLEYIGFRAESPVQRSNIPCEIYLSIIEDMLSLPDNYLHEQMQKTGALYKMLSVLVEAQRVEGRDGVARYDYPQEVYVETLKEHISRQYSYVRISDLAKYIGVNRSYLTVIFKKETGMSPQKYLMNYRMEKAAEMLVTGNLPLKEIARRVGYADPFTFSKTFKTHFAISPSLYRKNKEDV